MAAMNWDDWYTNWTPGKTPEDYRNFSDTFGFSPAQMATQYNKRAGTNISALQAARNMGVTDPYTPVGGFNYDPAANNAIPDWGTWSNASVSPEVMPPSGGGFTGPAGYVSDKQFVNWLQSKPYNQAVAEINASNVPLQTLVDSYNRGTGQNLSYEQGFNNLQGGSGFMGPAGYVTDQQFVQWLQSKTPEEARQEIEASGIPYKTLVDSYNRATGQNISYEQGFNNLQTPGTNFNIPDSAATSTSTATGGIDWNGPLGKALLPQLLAAAQALPGLTKDYGKNLQSMYGNLMRQALQPGAFQGTLNNLASRNILNSSVASNALSNTATDIARNVGNQAFPSFQAGLNKELALPGALASLAAQNTSAKTTNTNTLPLYQIMANMLMG